MLDTVVLILHGPAITTGRSQLIIGDPKLHSNSIRPMMAHCSDHVLIRPYANRIRDMVVRVMTGYGNRSGRMAKLTFRNAPDKRQYKASQLLSACGTYRFN